MHVGGAQLLVIDVDNPANVPAWLWPLLDRAVFRRTTTDPVSKRGHYIYRLRPGERFGGGLGKLKPPKGKGWGEVRCYGGAIVLAPTFHPRAAEGGAYTAGRDEPIPYRPDEIAAKLAPAADPVVYEPMTPAELDAKVAGFVGAYTDDGEPYALRPIVAAFDATPGGRHASMWDALCWALREAKAGRFPAQRAVDALRDRWDAAVSGEARDPDEFNRMVRDAVTVADASNVAALQRRAGGFASAKAARMAHRALGPGGAWHPDTLRAKGYLLPDRPQPATASRFQLVSARELAEPVEPMLWLVRGVWPERSAGVLAGDKKSMKTWNLQALAVAVAAGTALFDKYHVTSPGPVLYLSGEGGRNTFANRHQVIAERYGITGKMLRELPLWAEFGVSTLTDRHFTDAVKRHLDTLQPKLVILDPLYAYHPSDVEVQNVYARGPMLADLRTLVGDEAALIVGDHFNKTSTGRLDLANIAQAGMAQWADSWILQKHREAPNLDESKFWLEVETGTRRGGGKHLEVDWTLERDASDPDVILWTGVDWDSRPMIAKSAGGQVDTTVQAILQVVSDHPYELTETQVLDKVGGRREKARNALLGLKANGGVVVKKAPRMESGRTRNRDLVGLGEHAERLRRNRLRANETVPTRERVERTRTGDGNGSERVEP
ncbi:hypothetical protein A5773_13010 [Mycobacterium sp. 852014-52450_SCH5900713]|nr:hypothetical protein A5773_13010 [Mycobacterium sp. 852014-52450_SCH5900713]